MEYRLEVIFLVYHDDNISETSNYLLIVKLGQDFLSKIREIQSKIMEMNPEIQMVILESISLVSLCDGCYYDCPGQRDHMEPPYGCLSNPSKY